MILEKTAATSKMRYRTDVTMKRKMERKTQMAWNLRHVVLSISTAPNQSNTSHRLKTERLLRMKLSF
jgi:hypothetical protein